MIDEHYRPEGIHGDVDGLIRDRAVVELCVTAVWRG
jgi:hypothetical protein